MKGTIPDKREFSSMGSLANMLSTFCFEKIIGKQPRSKPNVIPYPQPLKYYILMVT